MAQRRNGQERLGIVEPSRGASALEALSGLIDWEPAGRWLAAIALLDGGRSWRKERYKGIMLGSPIIGKRAPAMERPIPEIADPERPHGVTQPPP